MSVNGKFKDITRADLLAEADRFGVRRANDLLADVRAAVENWPSHAKEAGLIQTTSERVAADFRLQSSGVVFSPRWHSVRLGNDDRPEPRQGTRPLAPTSAPQSHRW